MRWNKHQNEIFAAEVQILRIPWTIPLFGKQTHTCVILISMCANILQYWFVGNLNLSNICSYFLFYLKKMFIAMKTEINMYASWNSKNITDFILLVSWSPWEKTDRKLRHKKDECFPMTLYVSQLLSPGTGLVLFILLE